MKRQDWDRLWRLGKLGRRHLGRLLLTLLVMVLGVGINVLRPLLMKRMVDSALPERNLQLLILLSLLLIAASLLQAGVASVQTLLTSSVGLDIADTLRAAVYAKLVRSSLRYLGRHKPGALTYLLTRECGRVGQVFVAQELLPAIFNVLLASGLITIMALLNWQLTLAALILLPFGQFVTRVVGDRLKRLEAASLQLLAQGEVFLQETLSNIKTIQIRSQESWEIQRWRQWIRQHYQLYRRQSVIRDFARLVLNRLLQSLGLAIVFGFGAWQILNGDLTLGILIAFLAYVPQLYAALEAAQLGLVGAITVQPALERIFEHLDAPLEIADPLEATPLPSGPGLVEFEHVTFTHDPSRAGLQDLSFTVQPGETVAIVGTSGSGKSTIFDLLLRFYDPEQGTVRVNGCDVRTVRLAEVRQAISLVSQEVFLWNTSIWNNLRYGNTAPSQDEIERAMAVAQLRDFIRALPTGYHAVVGERGLALSGGERQRLMIVRGLLAKVRIFLLDEITSGLDAATADKLLAALDTFLADRTVLMVTHRLADALRADRVLVLDEGRLVECGPPHELLARRGRFFRLYLGLTGE